VNTNSPLTKPLHLGLITSDLTLRHGWGQVSVNLIEAFRVRGIRMTIIAARNTPALDGIPVHAILPPLHPREAGFNRKLIQCLPQMRKLLQDATHLHVTAEHYAPLGAWCAGVRPLYMTIHGSYVHLPRISRWPMNHVYRWSFQQGTLCCVSRYTATIAQEIIPGARSVVIPNGVQVERYLSLERKPGTQPTILSVGAVKRRKGMLELVQAMPSVLQTYPEAQCVIIGSLDHEAGYVDEIRQQIAALHLESYVHLLGHVDEAELLRWYARADVFALPSLNDGWKFEGFGLVYLEASAAGLPVIGTMDTGAADAIDDGITGLLIPQDDVENALPRAIMTLLDDPHLRAQMGAAGRLKAHQQTWDQVAEHLLTLYGAPS
jgi:phosphatidyl-myo-inositol dimannoside synthase